MADEEQVETEVEEADSEIVLETSKEKEAEEPDGVQKGGEEAEPKEEPEQADEEPGEAEGKEKVDFAAELEKVRQELQAELKPEEKKEEKKVYTKDELRNYRRQVEQKLEDGELSRAQYLAYIEQIEDLNEERLQAELDRRSSRKISRTRAEENVQTWAQQNAPELLDGRTKRSKESISFAKKELGAELVDGNWVIPEQVGRVLFGLAQGQGPEVQKAEARGREQALKEKEVRDRDLQTGDKPPGEKTPTKKAKDKLTAIEKDVQERLGLSPNAMKHFKRLRGHSDVEILQ